MRHIATIIIVLIVIAAVLGVGVKLLPLFGIEVPFISNSEQVDDGHGHSHGESGHAHGDEKTSQITVWDDKFEIFLEHPLMVAGHGEGFVTHVTNRTTLKPRVSGPVTFIITDSSGKSIKHTEDKPARDGIYIPELTFPAYGIWELSLAIPAGGGEYVIDLGDVAVYKNEEQTHDAPPSEDIEGISFLKEQQWKMPFETQAVKLVKMQAVNDLAIPESAILKVGEDSVAFVQLAGETFEERILKTGAAENGYVQVLTGLAEGEQVVVKGAEAVSEAGHGAEVEMSAAEIRRYGIETGKAGAGKFDVKLNVAGEIKINTDRMAHIVPRVKGIVRKVNYKLGDPVKKGDVLAVIESSELGAAKIEYLGDWGEVSCCALDLARAQLIHDNTIKLIETLKDSPSLETLQNSKDVEMGENLTKLVSAYAEYSFAKDTYTREKKLYEDKITSKQEFLKHQNAFEKAEALYTATRDSVTFEVKRNLNEASVSRQLQMMKLKASERKLKILGLTNNDITELELLAQSQDDSNTKKVECANPDCAECQAKKAAEEKSAAALKETEEKLAYYTVTAPFDGKIISKHITLGETLKDDSDMYVLADLDTVWVDLQVYQKDMQSIKVGQKATVSLKSSIPQAEGVIDYVEPVIDQQTRTGLVRIVLDNKSADYRPGAFVSADIYIDEHRADIVVPQDSVQTVEDHTCVFVRNDHGFEAREVSVGTTDGKYVEILKGLKRGETIVTKNSFRLKAELTKSPDTGHAGHSH